MLITCHWGNNSDCCLCAVYIGLQENGKITKQSHIQIRQKYIHAGHVADFALVSILPFVWGICNFGHHKELSYLDCDKHFACYV